MTPLDGPANEKGKEMPAIYSLKGDVLKICVGSPQDPARPTELASKEGGTSVLITFKRLEAGKDKENKPAADNEAIQGAWKVAGFEVKGKGPDESILKIIMAQKWVFTADKIVVETPGEKDDTTSYKLDPSAKPKELDITPQGKDTPEGAIYSLEGDVLKIAAPGPEGGPRPTEFAPEEGGKTVLLTLKRQSRDDKDK